MINMLGFIIILFIIVIFISIVYNKKIDNEPYVVDFRSSNINTCAKSCKKLLNCNGFVLDPYDQCILFSRKIEDTDNFTNRDIICNKLDPITRFKYNSGVSRLDKIKNAIYNCKSRNRYAKLFSNDDKLTNITGLVNYGLNNTLIDYKLTDCGPFNKIFV